MGNGSAAYERFAWWLTREQLGLCLRERYRVPKELPPRLLKLVRKLQAVEGNHELSPSLSTLFSKLDALEGNQLLRLSATIILAFTCAAPFVLLFSGLVGYGVRSFIH